MQITTVFLKALLTTVAFASYTNAYAMLNERALPVPATHVNRLDKRQNINFVGAPADGKDCSTRHFTANQITTAGSDAATRLRDQRLVVNPANPRRQGYPHQFRTQEFAWADPRCTAGQPNGELFEYPIFTDGLFDEASRAVGNERIFFYWVGADAVFCGLGTHEGAPGNSFNLC